MRTKPTVFAVVAIAAAAGPVLHDHAAPDCNPRIELCAPSQIAYLPDEPPPAGALQLIAAPLVAAASSSAPGPHHLRAVDLTTGSPALGAPALTVFSS